MVSELTKILFLLVFQKDLILRAVTYIYQLQNLVKQRVVVQVQHGGGGGGGSRNNESHMTNTPTTIAANNDPDW